MDNQQHRQPQRFPFVLSSLKLVAPVLYVLEFSHRQRRVQLTLPCWWGSIILVHATLTTVKLQVCVGSTLILFCSEARVRSVETLQSAAHLNQRG